MLARAKNSIRNSIRHLRIVQRVWPSTPQPTPQQHTSDIPPAQELTIIDTSGDVSSSSSNNAIRRNLAHHQQSGEASPSAHVEGEPHQANDNPATQQVGEPHHIEPAEPAVLNDDDGLEEHQLRHPQNPSVIVLPIEPAPQRRIRLQQEEKADLQELTNKSYWTSWLTTTFSGGLLFLAQYLGVYYTEGKKGCEESITNPGQKRGAMPDGTYAIPFIALSTNVTAWFLDTCGQGYGPFSWLAYGAYKLKKGEIVKGTTALVIGTAWIIPSILLPVFAAKTYADQSKDQGYSSCQSSATSVAFYEAAGEKISSAGSTALYVMGSLLGTAGYLISTRFGLLSGSWAQQRIAQDAAQDRQILDAVSAPQLR